MFYPVEDERERAAVTAISEVFSTSSDDIPPLKAPGTVVALGPGSLTAARLYARLTGRAVRSARTVEDLVRMKGLAVVVARSREITAGLLHGLYVLREGDAPGIICADDGSSLRTQAIVRAVAARLCRRPGHTSRPRLIFVGDDFVDGTRRTPEVWMLGAGASPDIVDRALGVGADALVLMTHSDGMDARLTDARIICCIKGAAESESRTGEDLPRCVRTGQCHRRAVSVAEALQSKVFVPVNALRAKTLVWVTCWGIRVQSDPVDVRWSLGEQIRNSHGVGAVVTSWGRFIYRRHQTIEIGKALDSGASLGRWVGEFNRRWATRGAPLCILGDPSMSIPRPRSIPPPLFEPPAFTTGAMVTSGHTEFFKRLIEDTNRESVRKPYDTIVERLKSAAAHDNDLDAAMDLLCALKEPSDVWWPRVRDMKGREGRCPNCAAPIVVGRVSCADLWREYTICSGCDLVRDLPYAGMASLRQTAPRRVALRLSGAVIRGDWRGRLLVRGYTEADSTEVDVRHTNGALRSRIDLPAIPGTGPWIASFRVVTRAKVFAAVSFPLRNRP